MSGHHPQEDGSVSQNTPTLTKNLSDININTWTLRNERLAYSVCHLKLHGAP